MVSSVLVTGSAERVGQVSAALRGAGAQVVEAIGLEQVGEAVRRLGPESVGCYIQLPVALRPTGEVAVAKVRSFLEEGLMNRFRLAETVVPVLSGDARVVLVAGHTPDSPGTPDDQRARIALLQVLAHAIRADKAPATVQVRVVETADVDRIVATALTSDPGFGRAAADVRRPDIPEDEMSYSEWRTEVLGLATMEF